MSWRIGDDDASYFSRPYAIRHARQDVPLHEMLSFNLPFPGPVSSPFVGPGPCDLAEHTAATLPLEPTTLPAHLAQAAAAAACARWKP